MGSGKVGRRTPWQSVQRCAGDCGARVASPCGDDRRHGVAAESLEVLRQQSNFKAGSSNVQSPILEVAKSVLSKFVRTWHCHCETHLMKRGWRAKEVADFTTKGYDASPHWFAPHQARDWERHRCSEQAYWH